VQDGRGSEPSPIADDDLRVGDTERRAVDERLHRAVGDGLLTLSEYDERARDVWAARTRGELAVVVRDLPGGARPVPVSTTPASSGRRRSVAVMGEERLAGLVRPGEGVEGYAVMGKTTLDLRRDDLPADVQVRAVAVMGEVEVLVPDGAAVHLSGLAVMGARDVRVAPAVPGGPQVHLTASAVMGSVTVRSGAGASAVPSQPTTWVPAGAMSSGSVRQRGRRLPRHKKLMLAGIAVVALGGLGVFHGGDGNSGSPDDSRTYFVSSDQTAFAVPPGAEDVTVVVPDGVHAEVSGGVDHLKCDVACSPGSGNTVRISVGPSVDRLEVETLSEHAD
jgi:hypothetical protein